MAIQNETLVLDLIEWVDREPRTYTQVMSAWSTSCPRLPIWEDSVDLGFVARRHSEQSGVMVTVTDAGRSFLSRMRTARSATAGIAAR